MLAARLFSQQLDRSKPLWELWLVEGLEGDRFAIVGKTHHCMVDGVSGVDITSVLFDLEKDPDTERDVGAAEQWLPEPEPSTAQLLAEALVERAISPARGRPRRPRASLRRPRRAAAQADRSAAGRRRRSPGPASARPTPPSTSRSARTAASPGCGPSLDDLKQVKNELGGTVNDVILAAVAGALGRYLRARGHATDRPRDPGDGPGQRPHRGAEGRARQPGLEHDGPAPGLVRGPGRAPAPRQRDDGRPEAVEAGDGRGADDPARRLRAADDRRPGGAAAVAPALLQPRRHQRPRPAVPAVPDGPPDGARSSRWCRWPSARRSASGS